MAQVVPMGNAPTASGAADYGFEVAVVESDVALRTRLLVEAGPAAQAFDSPEGLDGQRVRGRPTVVVLGPGLATPKGFELVEQLAGDDATVGVVVVAQDLSTELLQHALRAGARDALALTEGEAALRGAIRRVGEHVVGVVERAGSETKLPPGRLIVSFSTKGGVGKSTVATNVAVAMARRSPRPVALVDADLQFGDVAVLLNVPPQQTVVDAAAAIHHDDPELMRSLVSRHPASGLLVLPAPVEPSAADQVRPQEMLQILDSLRKFCGVVVVDMPPHFDDFVLALVEAADEVLLVASMDLPAIKNLKVGMQTLDLLSLAGPKLKLVLNRANAKAGLDVAEIEKALTLSAGFQIPSDLAVPQSVNKGIPVVIDNPKSPAAHALEAMAAELLGLPAPVETRKRWRGR